MKTFLNIMAVMMLMAFAPAATELPSLTHDNATEEYCNKRFNYCLQYPSDYFLKMEKSDNGDGITLKTPDEAIDLQVTGSYNVMDWSIKDIYYHTFDQDIRGDLNTQVVTSLFDDTFSEVTLKSGNRLEFFQTYLLDNAYVTINISVPANTPELLEQLRKSVNLSVSV
ncbi:MAG: hypothetical protein DHS20C18_12240 [Saprospiraceae bacterium]|nr:MAG: hypothetical protein DHS20C18_12240 [Saprospiraceae bacterium]